MRRKLIICITIFLLLLSSCSSASEFNDVKEEREKIVDNLMDGKYSINEYGYFELPEEEQYLSDGGKCCVVEYEYQKIVVYFFSYLGMLGDSRGFLFIVDAPDEALINAASKRFNFVDLEHIEGKWYSCKTSD